MFLAKASGQESGLKSPPECRRLLWWSHAELDQTALRIDIAWRAWHEDWIGVSGASKVRCHLAFERPLDLQSWRGFGATGKARAWIEGTTEAAVGSLLYGDHSTQRVAPSSTLAKQVQSHACHAVMSALTQALQLQDVALLDEPQQSDVAAWSGAVVAVLPLGEGEIQMLLSGEAVAALLPSPPNSPALLSKPVSSLTAAIESRKLALATYLRPFELDLGSLAALQVGDVIPLTHPLDAPLWVKSGDAIVCPAFLGQRHGLKAIEVVRA